MKREYPTTYFPIVLHRPAAPLDAYDLILVDAYVKLNRLHRETLYNLKWVARDDALKYWKTQRHD
jgi:hypothetical protein